MHYLLLAVQFMSAKVRITESLECLLGLILNIRIRMLEILYQLLKEIQTVFLFSECNFSNGHSLDQMADASSHDLSTLASVESLLINV